MSLNLNALETSFDLIAPRGEELMDEFYTRPGRSSTSSAHGMSHAAPCPSTARS
jgi:hypothetical protein